MAPRLQENANTGTSSTQMQPPHSRTGGEQLPSSPRKDFSPATGAFITGGCSGLQHEGRAGGRNGGARAGCCWMPAASGRCNLSAFVPLAWWCALISPPRTVNLSAGLRSSRLTSDSHSFFHKLISQIDKLKCTVCPRSLNHTGFW